MTMAQSSGPNELFDPTKMLTDFIKTMEQFKVPGIDMTAIMEARRKDFEALTAANQTALQGMQALGEKQAEILRTTLTELQSLVQQATQPGSATEKSVKTGELVQQALQKALANMRELAEAGSKAQADTFAVVSKRVQENIQEVKALLQPKK
jgi:phasin family protein